MRTFTPLLISTCADLGPTPPAASAYSFFIALEAPLSSSITMKNGLLPNRISASESSESPFAVTQIFNYITSGITNIILIGAQINIGSGNTSKIQK